MTRFFFLILSALLLGTTAHAQDVTVTGKVKGKIPAGTRVYLLPAGQRQASPDTVAFDGGRLRATVGGNPWGLYDLITVSNRQQAVTPVRLTVEDGKAQLRLTADGGRMAVDKPGSDNRALAVFNDGYTERSKRFWMEGRNMDNSQQKALINGYPALADSVIGALKPSATVAQYLRLWAQVLRFEAANNMMFATGNPLSAVGFDLRDLARETLPHIDSPMAALFNGTPAIAITACKSKVLRTQLAALRANVKDTALLARCCDATVGAWLKSFNYQERFSEGEAELKAVTADFGLGGKYMAEFQSHKAAIKAAPFPAGVKLCDTDGRAVDFSRFRGRWVYIDMWASWCVPCIKEIPHLKKLEEDLAGRNIAFVSISIDTDRAAWLKKVAQLGLTGNQLINDDGSLGKALNVNAIPRFLIYDPDGRLYDDNATRPSDSRTKPALEALAL